MPSPHAGFDNSRNFSLFQSRADIDRINFFIYSFTVKVHINAHAENKPIILSTESAMLPS